MGLKIRSVTDCAGVWLYSLRMTVAGVFAILFRMTSEGLTILPEIGGGRFDSGSFQG